MRVLHLDTDLGWRGGQQQVVLLAQGLAGHARFAGEAVTVCRPGSALAARLSDLKLPRAELDVASPWSLSGVWKLRRLAAELDVDIVHAHASHAHNLAALATIASRRHLVATRRVDFRPKGMWKYHRCVRVVAVSQAIGQILAERGLAPGSVEVILDGIDGQRFVGRERGRGRAALGLEPDDLAVLCVAALEDHKDHATLLEAWARIAVAHPRAYLLLAGDGSLRGQLAQRAANLPRVRLLGFRDDIPDLLAAADAAVLTSHLEGLGTAIMDAMHCALPVLVTRAGGLPELVSDGVDGLSVQVRDAAAVAEGLGRILTEPSLRVRLGTAAAITAGRRFTAAAMVDAHVDLYDRIMRGA